LREDLCINTIDIEMLWVEIDKDSLKTNSNLVLGVIYRRPGSDPRECVARLNDTLHLIEGERKLTLHTGDYNRNLLNAHNHLPTNDFIEANFSHSLFPVIDKPTRITATTASLIDNIFINSTEIANSKSGILLWDVSDHFPVFYIHFETEKSTEVQYRTGRIHNTKNKAKFSEILSNIDWSQVTDIYDTQLSSSIFHETLTKAYNDAFPITRTRIGYSNRLEWLTPGLKRSISTKHKLHATFLKHPTPSNKSIYKTFKNRLSHIMKIAERESYQNALSSSKTNLRKSWKILKNIINKNRKFTQHLQKITINGHLWDDSHLIANSFNRFYTNIGNSLDQKIPTNNIGPVSFITTNYTNNLFLNPATELEIDKIVDNRKECAVGWDLFPSSIFKENKS
jgi:hypothetical protein